MLVKVLEPRQPSPGCASSRYSTRLYEKIVTEFFLKKTYEIALVNVSVLYGLRNLSSHGCERGGSRWLECGLIPVQVAEVEQDCVTIPTCVRPPMDDIRTAIRQILLALEVIW